MTPFSLQWLDPAKVLPDWTRRWSHFHPTLHILYTDSR
jgi:hypothetical protein